jgi:hypothetical protein
VQRHVHHGGIGASAAYTCEGTRRWCARPGNSRHTACRSGTGSASTPSGRRTGSWAARSLPRRHHHCHRLHLSQMSRCCCCYRHRCRRRRCCSSCCRRCRLHRCPLRRLQPGFQLLLPHPHFWALLCSFYFALSICPHQQHQCRRRCRPRCPSWRQKRRQPGASQPCHAVQGQPRRHFRCALHE